MSNIARITIGMFASLFLYVSAGAYFIDMANGAKPESMGEAYVAAADDVNSILFNPAGFARLSQAEFSGMYSDLYSNLNSRLYNQTRDRFGYNFIGAGIPVPELAGGLGFGWTQFYTELYQENIFTLAYGHRLWESYMLDSGLTIDAGVALKALHWQVGENEFTSNPDNYPFSEHSKLGLTADAGIRVSPWQDLYLGFSAENILPANVGLTVVEYVPAILRIGAAYTLRWKSTIADSLLISVEGSSRDGLYLPKLGLESQWLGGFLQIRAGINPDQWTAGLGFHYSFIPNAADLQLDYSFSYPFYLLDSAGSHRVGLTLGWGKTDAKRDGAVEKAMEKMTFVNSALRAMAISQESLRAAREALNHLETAVAIKDPASYEIARKSAGVVEESAQTTILAVEVLDAAALDGPDNLKSKAKEAKINAGEVQTIAQTIEELTNNIITELKIPVKTTPLKKVAIQQDKNPGKIVVGVEQKVLTDFGNLRTIEPALQALISYLKQSAKCKIEFQYLTPAELRLETIQGGLDFIIGYEDNFSEYRKANLLIPAATIRSHGQTGQPCVLLVREDAPISSLLDLKGKRLGYSNNKVLAEIGPLFFSNLPAFESDKFFSAFAKQKNVRDSLWALQLDAIDAVVEYAYIRDICRKFPEIHIREIALSKPVPNASLLMRVSQNRQKAERMQRLLLALQDFTATPEGESFMNVFSIEDIVLY